SAALLVDHTGPTITAATLSYPTIVVGANVTNVLTVAATDNAGGSGLPTSGDIGEYWVDGTAAGPASGSRIALATRTANLSVSGLTAGTHTVYVRVKDRLGNWSAVTSVSLSVLATVRASNDTAPQLAIQNNAAGNALTQTITPTFNVFANDTPAGVPGQAVVGTSPTVTRTGNCTLANPNVTGPNPNCATMTVTLNANGTFSYTLTVPSSFTGGVTNTAQNIRASKVGTYTFPYAFSLTGTTSATATVTVRVR
ncbi:MAG: hypothetical protein RLZZ393_836, partial [Pseudomonadota bacterium]